MLRPYMPYLTWHRPASPRAFALGALLWMLLLAAFLPALARAQTIKPWTPPADSFSTWASEARSRFETNKGDSVGGDNLRAYELVGMISRRLLHSLGPAQLVQAHALKPVLDTLGLTTDVTVDPLLPNFALVMVRNPTRFTANAVGYLYWYKGTDLRMQGVLFKGGLHPTMRAWWTGQPDHPYEWAIVDEQPTTNALELTLFRLNALGTEWTIQQDETRGGVLGEPGEAAWTDINLDGSPELVSWTRGRTDSLFVECDDCPRLITERVFTEGPDGFELLDARLLPSPYSTFVLFVRFLRDHNLASASRLLADPSLVKSAVASGFGEGSGKGVWHVEYGEPGVAWPHWLALRLQRPNGARRYILHFLQRDGHWLIQNWIEPKRSLPAASAPSVTIPGRPSPAGTKPATRKPVTPKR
jgi:hypothetical protein